jgi:D-serine deaminase-like pyridoxal phosphate-dependent protein
VSDTRAGGEFLTAPPALAPRPLDEIDTPALLVDLPALDRNIGRMAAFFQGRAARLRPHAKTHKTPRIAERQMAAGAAGITCAKLDEAEVMLRAGIPSVLVANQIVGPLKTARLARLSRLGELIVAVDSLANAREIDEAAGREGVAVNVIIEVDVGMGRSGSRSVEQTLELAGLVERLPCLRFRGLMGYEGHAVFVADKDERARLAREANALLVSHADRLRDAGLAVEIVSAGGSGTYDTAGLHPGVTEVQAGSYATMDATYRRILPEFECAVTVLATVISRPAADTVVLDCGMKSITRDFTLPEVRDGDGGAEVVRLSEEHTVLRLASGRAPAVGMRVELIPGHGCTTFNLHDVIHAVRDGVVVEVWPVAARGGSR